MPVSPHPCQHWEVSFFLILAHLVSEQLYAPWVQMSSQWSGFEVWGPQGSTRNGMHESCQGGWGEHRVELKSRVSEPQSRGENESNEQDRGLSLSLWSWSFLCGLITQHASSMCSSYPIVKFIHTLAFAYIPLIYVHPSWASKLLFSMWSPDQLIWVPCLPHNQQVFPDALPPCSGHCTGS